MASTELPAPSPRRRIAGWILSVLVVAMLCGPSAMSKFLPWEGKQEMFDHIGYSIPLIQRIGVVEVVCALLLLVPQTAFVAAILLTGYLGGAVATHVRVGDEFFVPIVIGVVVWVALGLRKPGVFALTFGLGRPPSSAADA